MMATDTTPPYNPTATKLFYLPNISVHYLVLLPHRNSTSDVKPSQLNFGQTFAAPANI